jgi:hypothetical protein
MMAGPAVERLRVIRPAAVTDLVPLLLHGIREAIPLTRRMPIVSTEHRRAFLTTVVVVLSAASACRAAQSVDTGDPIRRLVDQYRLLRTLHCKAVVAEDFKTIPPGIFHIDGTQEYWADGDKYRILQLKNTSMFPGTSHDVRWDGERFQWFNVADSTLIFSRKARQNTPYLAEPVALLPVAFLNPAGDDVGVKLSLADLESDGVRSRLPKGHHVGTDGTEFEFPGGKIGPTDFTYRVDFGRSPSYLPTKIRRISSDGVELSTTELSYQAVSCAQGIVYLPRTAKLTNRTTDNRVIMVAAYSVSSIEADTAITPETFTLDFQTAKNVIDIDHRRHAIESESKPNQMAASTDQDSSHTAAQDASISTETAVITPAPVTNRDSAESPLMSLVLLFGGLTALFAGFATMLRRKRFSGGPV